MNVSGNMTEFGLMKYGQYYLLQLGKYFYATEWFKKRHLSGIYFSCFDASNAF